MVVIGDVELLLGDVVSLPDVEGLTVGAQVGPKVDAVLRFRVGVGRDADLGAAQGVVESLERSKLAVVREAVAAVAQVRSASQRHTRIFGYSHRQGRAVSQLLLQSSGGRVDLKTDLLALRRKPLDLFTLSGRGRGRGRRGSVEDEDLPVQLSALLVPLTDWIDSLDWYWRTCTGRTARPCKCRKANRLEGVE